MNEATLIPGPTHTLYDGTPVFANDKIGRFLYIRPDGSYAGVEYTGDLPTIFHPITWQSFNEMDMAVEWLVGPL